METFQFYWNFFVPGINEAQEEYLLERLVMYMLQCELQEMHRDLIIFCWFLYLVLVLLAIEDVKMTGDRYQNKNNMNSKSLGQFLVYH